MKIDIKIPVLRGRCIILIGSYEDIKRHAPFGSLEHFSEVGYLARTAFKRLPSEKGDCPNTVVIHSHSAAISVLAHEAVHAASYIQDAIGIHPDWNNDELTAYLVQHITERCENALGMYKPRRRKRN